MTKKISSTNNPREAETIMKEFLLSDGKRSMLFVASAYTYAKLLVQNVYDQLGTGKAIHMELKHTNLIYKNNNVVAIPFTSTDAIKDKVFDELLLASNSWIPEEYLKKIENNHLKEE